MTKAQMIGWIDGASYGELLSRWRFEPVGSPWFAGEVGDHFTVAMSRKRKDTPHDDQVSVKQVVGLGRMRPRKRIAVDQPVPRLYAVHVYVWGRGSSTKVAAPLILTYVGHYAPESPGYWMSLTIHAANGRQARQYAARQARQQLRGYQGLARLRRGTMGIREATLASPRPTPAAPSR